MKLTAAPALLALTLLSAASLRDDRADRPVPTAPGWSVSRSFWDLVGRARRIFSKPETTPEAPSRTPVVPDHPARRVSSDFESESETDSLATGENAGGPAAANGGTAPPTGNPSAAAPQPAGPNEVKAAGAPPVAAKKVAAGAPEAEKQGSTLKLLCGVAALFAAIVAAVFVLQRRFPAHPILAYCGAASKPTHQSSEYTLADAPVPPAGPCREIV